MRVQGVTWVCTHRPWILLIFTHVFVWYSYCMFLCVWVLGPSLHWCAEPIWLAGWIVPQQSIMWWFGSIYTVTSATLFFPSLLHGWCGTSHVVLLECLFMSVWLQFVCVCVREVTKRPVYGSLSCQKSVCPRSGHMDGHQPAWLRLLLPLHHLLDHSRCHNGTDREKYNRNTHKDGMYAGWKARKWPYSSTLQKYNFEVVIFYKYFFIMRLLLHHIRESNGFSTQFL